MAAPAVVFDHVWKKFRRGERHDSLRDLVPSVARRLLRRTRPHDLENAQEFWALRDVAFAVAQGEALGIIGPNGAGKSTTLKLLTRILRPTRGTCYVRGRIGALIEVAAGFHPDLTGRENIYLQGAIMGMKRAEIARRLDEIVEFAGVADFVDTPVKRYSSGMNARLGFSIAAHLDPDVLIIDEVLSVGDMSFQERCVQRMADFKRQGTTIVFVSHNLQAVSALCDRACLLNRVVAHIGPSDEVIRHYVSSLSSEARSDVPTAVRIGGAELSGRNGVPANAVAAGADLSLKVQFDSDETFDDLTFGFIVYRSHDNLVVYDANLTGDEVGIPRIGPGLQVAAEFRFCAHLTRGLYHVACHVFHNPTQRFLGRLSPAAVFSVSETRTWTGVANLDVRAAARVRDRGIELRAVQLEGVR